MPYMEHTLNKGLLDREMEGRMDRQMGDRWMDGWMDKASQDVISPLQRAESSH